MTQNQWLRVAGLIGFWGVAMGAFGAHVLSGYMAEPSLEVYDVGVRYHIIHSLAMLALSARPSSSAFPVAYTRACWAWLVGIILFSGSLYLLSITTVKWMGMITPFGGVALLLGWLVLVVPEKE